MRMTYPEVTSMGLGNNLITVAKAHRIAESCQMTYQRPAWPRTEHVRPARRDGYSYYFPTTRAHRMRLAVFRQLLRIQRKLRLPIGPPVVPFDRATYARLGIADAGEACAAYLAERGLSDPARSAVVSTSGMWGGYLAIRRARPWLRALVSSHGESLRRFEEIQARTAGRLRVVVDIKLGSYAVRNGGFTEGERNIRLPLEWFNKVCRRIRETADCHIILSTDGKVGELAAFLEAVRPVHYLGESHTDLIGLLLMWHADLVVCSNSTYSRLGCFLNDRPYVWLADTLVKDPSGRYGYLWKDGASPMPAWSKQSVPAEDGDDDAVRRCFAVGSAFSSLPAGLTRYLESGATLPIEIEDDLLYDNPVRLL